MSSDDFRMVKGTTFGKDHASASEPSSSFQSYAEYDQ